RTRRRSRRQYKQYDKARQRCTGLNLNHYKINFTENMPPHIMHSTSDTAAKRGKTISPFLSRRRVQTRQDRTKREQSRQNMP
ncbi:hypothetical protein, partial [Neisseria meningitidis]